VCRVTSKGFWPAPFEMSFGSCLVIHQLMPVQDSDRIGLGLSVQIDAQNSIPYIEQFSDLACRDEPRMKQSRNGVPGNAALNLGEWNCVRRHIEGFLAGAVRDELRFTFNFDLPRFPSSIVRGNWNA